MDDSEQDQPLTPPLQDRNIMSSISPVSAASRASRQSNESAAFSQSAEDAVRRFDGPVCWLCQRPEPQIAHVISQEDRHARLWMKKGLVTFKLTDHLNGIPLCAGCHEEYDKHIDPGFWFTPKDLEYFIEYARNKPNGRLVPTASGYKSDQFPGPLNAGIPALEEKTWYWHGEPIASIHRAMMILGSGRIERLDRTAREQLQTLQDLYFCDNVCDIDGPCGDPDVDGGIDIDGSPAENKRRRTRDTCP